MLDITDDVNVSDLQEKVITLSEINKKLSLELEAAKTALQQCDKHSKNSHNKLQNKKAAADAANRAKSEFLASMSHQIRTPMNGILGMLSLVIDSKISERQRSQLEIANRSGNTLMALLNNLLDVYRLEAGTLQINVSSFNLHDAVEEVTTLFSENAFAKGLDIACVIHPNTPEWVAGDQIRFRQVLSNLVSNAINFTKDGEIVIRVSSLSAAEPYQVRFEIEDTGIGISEDRREYIFDHFTQARNYTDKPRETSGLGIPLSHELVRSMDGKLDYRSTVGEGSCFWFQLDFQKPDKSPVWHPEPKLQDRTVLVVQADNCHRQVLLQYLQQWGIRYHICEQVEQVETQLSSTPLQYWHGIILDYHLDQTLDGKLYNQLRNILASHPVPLLMLCASTPYQHKPNCAYPTPSLSKPINRNKLHQVLVSMLREQQKKPAPEAPNLRVPQFLHKTKSKKRILLVEDNLFNQRVAMEMLHRLNLDLEVANNGQEAIEKIYQQPYDLVLMDCQMPIMDGYTATAMIRRHENQQQKLHIPVIAMTASALEGDRERCIDAQMDDYISKPVTLKKLEQALVQWLNYKCRDSD